MRSTFVIASLLFISLTLASPAAAEWNTPIASKDGQTFSVEDLSIYWLRNLGKDALLDYMQTLVMYQEGMKQGLKPTEAERTEFINNKMDPLVYEQFKQLYSQQAIDRLVEYTIVAAKYELWLRDKIVRDNNISVTETEAREYFLANIDLFHLPEGAYLSIITVESQSKAEEAVQRLRQGENFNDLAAEMNMDADMRAIAGELGPYRKGSGMPEALEQAALDLTEGQYSQIIKANNYNILYCHKRYAQVSPTFEEIKDDLIADMVEARIDPYYIDELDSLMQREMVRFDLKADLFRPEDE